MLTRKDRDYLEGLADEIAETSERLAQLTATRDAAIPIALAEQGAGPTELARIFGLTRARIYQIRDGR